MEKLINRNVEYLRKQRGWTQKELAKKLGVPVSRIGSYEEFRCNVPVDLIEQMAFIFEIDLDSFIKKDLRRLVNEK